jgi:hypothetical protein
MKNILPVFLAILNDFKHVFSDYLHRASVLLKKYMHTYIQLLLEIYAELQEAAETDRIPLFFIVSIILTLILGTYLFFFALLN